jgi:hypothetical protein
VPKTGVNASSVRNNSPAAFAEQRVGWAALATKHGVSLGAVALSFAALPTVVTKLVVGMLRAE